MDIPKTPFQAIKKARRCFVWVNGLHDSVFLVITKKQARELMRAEDQFHVVYHVERNEIDIWAKHDSESPDLEINA